ncbi:PrsW family intramembrane metalloprotease [Candidatus Azambacteria bacterium]|nr:PrsW family intramembrane metalloprotease [Candidatus Azambacteria bacterium]
MFGQGLPTLLPILFLAVSPSLIWLFFYLKEDTNPEPRYWIFIMFLMGIVLAPIVISLEMAASKAFNLFSISPLGGGYLEGALLLFFIAPFIEEAAKYGAAHLALNKNPIMDEPVDAMIYVIVVALGFAAIENVFAIFSFIPIGDPGYFSAAFNFMSMRFITAVALHGLASGISGYYFAKFYFIKKDKFLIAKGLFFAASFHGLYNFLVSNRDAVPMVLAGILLGAGAALVIFMFNRLKHFQTYQQAAVDEPNDRKL